MSDAASDPTSPPVRLAPVVKDASLGNPSTKRLPMLVILSDNESTLPTDDLRGRLREFCNVIHVETTDDTQQHFKADRIPVAILFNADSEEIGRREHPWTIKDLETLARSVSTKAEATPQALHEPTNAQPAEPAIP
ncbi:MAG TPA: hypothetical protein PKY10_11400 [Lentisphaeria bacterium]|nr:hypothetical protein [Lentisphaeria bacterium]